MGFLGIFGLARIAPRLVTEILLAIEFGYPAAGGVDRLVTQVDRVGTHVGDVAVFIERLGDTHRLLGTHAQLTVGFLLQRTCRKRWIG